VKCMELKNVFNKKAVISSIVKVPFSKTISGMTQCPSNPGFASVKVQNVDFLKKPSVDNIFSLPLCSPNMLSSFKSKIGNVYCPVYILELFCGMSLDPLGSAWISSAWFCFDQTWLILAQLCFSKMHSTRLISVSLGSAQISLAK
jgi:hypothetical protein